MQTSTLKRHLKAKAHSLHPIVIIGNQGLTKAVSMETDRALTAHELIKVRINAENRDAVKAMAAELAEHCKADLVEIIGHIAILYRKNEE